MQAGIVGLPNSGKTTLFNALTCSQAEEAPYPFTTINPNVAEINIPDERLTALSELIHPQEVRPAKMRFVDIAGLVKGAHQGEGLGNEFLSHIRSVDVIVHILRYFPIIKVSHVEGSINPLRDLEIVNTELVLSDLLLLERYLNKLKKQPKTLTRIEQEEVKFLESLYEHLYQGKIVINLNQTVIKKYNLISFKPSLILINTTEDQYLNPSEELKQILITLDDRKIEYLISPVLLERELINFTLEERVDYCQEIGYNNSTLKQLTKKTNDILNQIFFYTIASRILQAWPVGRETSIKEAAGMIHSDIGEGLIKAEVVSYIDLGRVGSWAKAKESGLLRVEGKDSLVEDGDVIYFHFR